MYNICYIMRRFSFSVSLIYVLGGGPVDSLIVHALATETPVVTSAMFSVYVWCCALERLEVVSRKCQLGKYDLRL